LWHLNSEVGFHSAYVLLFCVITGIFMLPTERRVMKWFVRKPTTDSPRLLSLSPLRCGADATDVSGEPASNRQSSACADLSPPHHHHQHRSRIGEPIYRRKGMWYYKTGSQTSRHIQSQSFHHYMWSWFSSARVLLGLPTNLFPKTYSYHTLYTFTVHISLLRATCTAPPIVIIYQPDFFYPGVISYINLLFFFLAYTLLFWSKYIVLK